MESLIPYAFGGIFSLGGILVLGGAIKAIRGAGAAKKWPKTPGKLVSSSMKTHAGSQRPGSSISGKSYEPIVNYSYSVEEKTYSGSRIGIISKRGSKAYAETAIERIKASGELEVRYNPGKPEEAVLEARAPGSGLTLLLGVFCLGVGILALIAGPAFLAFFKS